MLGVVSLIMFSCFKKRVADTTLYVKAEQIYDSLIQSHPPFKKRIDSLYASYQNCETDSGRIENLGVLLNYLSGGHNTKLRREILNISNKTGYERGVKKFQLYLLYFYGSSIKEDSVNYYYELIRDWSEKKKDESIRSQNDIFLGNYYSYRREFRFCDSLVLGAIDRLKKNNIADNYLLSTAYYIVGKGFNVRFMNDTAVTYLNQAADYAMKDELYELAADIYFRIGECHLMESNFNTALEAYGKSLDLAIKINDEKSIASDYGAIGEIYSTKNDFKKAEEYLFKSLELSKRIDYKYQVAYTAASIAYMYFQQNMFDKALEYFEKSTQYYEKIGVEQHGYEITRNNLSRAIVNNSMKNYDKAKVIAEEVLISKYSKQDPSLTSEAYIVLADFYMAKHDVANAEKLALKSLEIAQENEFLTMELDIYKKLYELSESQNKFEKALYYHKKYFKLNDSLTNKPQIQKFAELENKMKEDRLNAEHERKELMILNEKSNKESQLKRQQYLSYGIGIGFTILLVFSVIIYRSLQDNKRKNIIISEQKREVELQKSIVEEKKKEVVDSIEYAKKIQEAILPSEEVIQSVFPESFILYQPKDIVAGDFYWMETTHDTVLIAAADCTGHGVPGAMVSVVCSNALNRAVKEFNLSDPGKILDKVRDLVIDTFQKSGSEVKDGMDISLVAIPKNRSNSEIKIKWAGANNPLWYISDNTITEIKPNKQPVGKFVKQDPFTTNEISLIKGSKFYLITDGFADQFGGPKGKKFKYKSLKQEILNLNGMSMKTQGENLQALFNSWKSSLEQVDDVTIIGIMV